MRQCDILFISNVPSFYKVSLYNEIAKYCSIYVVFIGRTDQVIIDEDLKSQAKFEFDIINQCIVEQRNIFYTFIRLCSLIYKVSYRFLILGGWDLVELDILLFLVPKKKNGVVCESSIYESTVTGFKGIVKRVLFSRISVVFPSGVPHSAILKELKFKGEIKTTGGVGLFYQPIKRLTQKEVRPLRYIYTGRLIAVKNLELLIDVFNSSGKDLTIVGKGLLECELKNRAKSNIHFIGFIENKMLGEIYSNYDCFILPSKSEPWGLVVEEALYYGLPVIVSDRVGCNIDMVEMYESGVIFKFDDSQSLSDAIDQLERNYEFYQKNAASINFDERNKKQLNIYLDLVK